MNKIRCFAVFGVCLIAFVSTAPASIPQLPFLYEAEPYAGVTFSGGHASDYTRGRDREIQVGTNQGVSGVFGYKYDKWQFEVEAAFRTSPVEHFWWQEAVPVPPFGFLVIVDDRDEARGSVRDTAFTFNGTYHFETRRIWRPYVGFGAGVSHLAIRDFRLPEIPEYGRHSDSDIVFAYQLMAGVRFDFDERTHLTIGYRFFASENARWEVGHPVFANETEELKVSGSQLNLLEAAFHFKF